MSGTEDGTAGARALGADRCPRCGARVTAGQQWCSLCHSPLGAPAADGPAAPDAEPAPDLAREADVLDGTGDLLDATAAGRPGRSGDLDPLAAEAMLAELAATSAAGRPLARGPLARQGRVVRGLLGCGAAAVLVAVLLLLVTLVGMLL